MASKQTDVAWSFEKVSKNQWLEKVASDLKGKSFDELRWKVNERIELDPLYHHEESNRSQPIGKTVSDRKWKVVQFVSATEIRSTNQRILSGLEAGAEAIYLFIPGNFSIDNLPGLLEGVALNYISLYIHTEEVLEENTVMDILNQLSLDEGHREQVVFSSGKWRSHLDTHRKGSLWKQPASLRMFTIPWVWAKEDWSDLDVSLGNLLGEISRLFEEYSREENLAVLRNLRIEVELGDYFFIEIARLRALQSVLENLLHAWGLSDAQRPEIFAKTSLAYFDSDAYQNMIRAASIGMAAVMGGADAVLIHPADVVSKDQLEYAWRTCINVQHMLRLESYLDNVNDPAAGSYYIEELTNQLAEHAWNQFRERQ